MLNRINNKIKKIVKLFISNINVKIAIKIFSIYFIIILIVFFLYPLIENISYLNLLKEGFISIIFSSFIDSYIIRFDFNDFYTGQIIIPLLILIGNILPIIFIFKFKKLLPYVIISSISFICYLLIGIIAFGFRIRM